MAQRQKLQGINRSAKTKQAASWLPAKNMCVLHPHNRWDTKTRLNSISKRPLWQIYSAKIPDLA